MDLRTYQTNQELSFEELCLRLGAPERSVAKWLTPRPEQQIAILTKTGGLVTPTDFVQTRIDWEAKRAARTAA
jgi:hypothetical protein